MQDGFFENSDATPNRDQDTHLKPIGDHKYSVQDQPNSGQIALAFKQEHVKTIQRETFGHALFEEQRYRSRIRRYGRFRALNGTESNIKRMMEFQSGLNTRAA